MCGGSTVQLLADSVFSALQRYMDLHQFPASHPRRPGWEFLATLGLAGHLGVADRVDPRWYFIVVLSVYYENNAPPSNQAASYLFPPTTHAPVAPRVTSQVPLTSWRPPSAPDAPPPRLHRLPPSPSLTLLQLPWPQTPKPTPGPLHLLLPGLQTP